MFGIFWGVSRRDRVLRSGAFQCPHCRKGRFGTLWSIEDWYFLLFVPLFAVDECGEYIKCHDCRHCFALPWMYPFLPRGGHLASDLRVELHTGAPVEKVEGRLVESGVDRESARDVIQGLIGDYRHSCPPCGLTYQEKVVACWECGRPLVKAKPKADLGLGLDDLA